MALAAKDHPIRGLVEGLKIQHGPLGSLLESVINQAHAYDFFNALCSHLIPHLAKSEEYNSLTRKWRRRIGTYRKREKMLRVQAIEEVTNALKTLSTEIHKTQFAKESQIAPLLIQSEEYLNGTRPTCIPPHFEKAADKLADACRVLLGLGAIQLVEQVADVSYIPEYEQRGTEYIHIDKPVIEKCRFYHSIMKIKHEQSVWRWDSFDEAWVCWSFLCLAQKCWTLKEADFEKEQLEYNTLSACEKSANLLGMHGYWCEMQGIRKQKQDHNTPFFTVNRFLRYLESISTSIINNNQSKKDSDVSLGWHALNLKLDGDKLLLIREEDEGRKKTALILTEFGGDSNPRNFFDRLLKNPGTDVTPADIGMNSNSPANLLKRAKLTKALKELFFTKGSRKNSIVVKALRIPRSQVPIAVQLELWKQIEELNLNTYKDV